MAFGPSISAPTLTGTTVVYPAELFAAWIVLTVTSLVLERLIRRAKLRIVRHTGIPPYGWFTTYHEVTRSTSNEPETYTVDDLKDTLARERKQWRRIGRRGTKAVIVAPVVEELTFRGGPSLLALTLGGAHLPLLVAGSLLWAAIHARNPAPDRRGTLPVFIHGLLYIYLWLIGLWWLAILVHAGNNLIAIALEAGKLWWRRRQHPLTPGDTHTVTVDDQYAPRNRDGLSLAYTADGDRLYVADVDPGDTTQVRVATTVGFTGYAYPITDTNHDPT